MDLPIQQIDIENTVFYQTFSQESMSDDGYMYKSMLNGNKYTVTFQLDDKTGNINVDFSKLQKYFVLFSPCSCHSMYQ